MEKVLTSIMNFNFIDCDLKKIMLFYIVIYCTIDCFTIERSSLIPTNWFVGNKKRKPKPKRKSESDDDDDGEDSPASNNIVHGKRTRKTINRPTNWSGSESENEDPYQTDESDEWQPTSDMTDSQLYSQDFSQI